MAERGVWVQKGRGSKALWILPGESVTWCHLQLRVPAGEGVEEGQEVSLVWVAVWEARLGVERNQAYLNNVSQ